MSHLRLLDDSGVTQLGDAGAAVLMTARLLLIA